MASIFDPKHSPLTTPPSFFRQGVWNGLAEWFGVEPEHMNTVLPNLPNFDSNIFSEADMFD